MEIVSLKCPECGSKLDFDLSRGKQCFCTYCGNKIVIDDTDYTYEYVDAAKIKELEYMERMERLKAEEKERKLQRIAKGSRLTARILLAIIILLLILAAISLIVRFKGYDTVWPLAACVAVFLGIFDMCFYYWSVDPTDYNSEEYWNRIRMAQDMARENRESMRQSRKEFNESMKEYYNDMKDMFSYRRH